MGPEPAEATEPLLLSIKDAAKVLGLSEWQVRTQLIPSGALPSVTVGKRLYVPASSLREYVEQVRQLA